MNVKLTNGQEIEIRPMTLFMGENPELLIEIADEIEKNNDGIILKIFPEGEYGRDKSLEVNYILHHPSKMVKICEEDVDVIFQALAEKDNPKFIIVTHSIIYLSRIRRFILEGVIKSSAVAIYNFVKDEDTGEDKIIFCELDEHGIWKDSEALVKDNSLLDELISFSSLMTDKGLRGKRK